MCANSVDDTRQQLRPAARAAATAACVASVTTTCARQSSRWETLPAPQCVACQGCDWPRDTPPQGACPGARHVRACRCPMDLSARPSPRGSTESAHSHTTHTRARTHTHTHRTRTSCMPAFTRPPVSHSSCLPACEAGACVESRARRRQVRRGCVRLCVRDDDAGGGASTCACRLQPPTARGRPPRTWHSRQPCGMATGARVPSASHTNRPGKRLRPWICCACAVVVVGACCCVRATPQPLLLHRTRCSQ
jgi:hypothetical protein